MLNILLSGLVCAAASLFFDWVVSAHVIAGSMHELYTCLFKHIPILPLKMSRCVANAVHPAVILTTRLYLSTNTVQTDGCWF